MDDETLTPFVDALSASLIIMVLVSISFIIQSALSITDSAKAYVEKSVQESNNSPIAFQEPISFDLENNELTYLVTFKLNEQQIEQVREDIRGQSKLHFVVVSSDTEKKSTANLLRFILALKIPKEVRITTEIRDSNTSLSKLSWSN